MEFGIKTEEFPDRQLAVLELSGEVDAYSSEKVKDSVIALVRAGCIRLVFDLADISYLDSSGLGVLVGALKRTREQGGDVAVVTDNPRWVRLFELTGLHKVLSLVSKREDAVAQLEAGDAK